MLIVELTAHGKGVARLEVNLFAPCGKACGNMGDQGCAYLAGALQRTVASSTCPHTKPAGRRQRLHSFMSMLADRLPSHAFGIHARLNCVGVW